MRFAILGTMLALSCFLSGCSSYLAVLQDSARIARTQEYQETQQLMHEQRMRNDFKS